MFKVIQRKTIYSGYQIEMSADFNKGIVRVVSKAPDGHLTLVVETPDMHFVESEYNFVCE